MPNKYCKPVITISGPHGTGKSTYAKAIAKNFNLRHVSAGTLFRKIGLKQKLNLIDLSLKADQDESFDLLIDDTIKKEADKGNVVIDGQLSAWMTGTKPMLKIYLTAPFDIRIKRISKREGINFHEAQSITTEREDREKKRFYKIYQIDLTDLSIYDLIVDTNILPLDEMITTFKNIIQEMIKRHSSG